MPVTIHLDKERAHGIGAHLNSIQSPVQEIESQSQLEIVPKADVEDMILATSLK